MTILAYLILGLITALAGAFVAWPILRLGAGRGRFVLGAAAVLFVLGVGGGLYVWLGSHTSRGATFRATTPRI